MTPTDTLRDMVQAALHLEPERPFKRQRHWLRFENMVHYLNSWFGLPEPRRMESFLKGCPKDWDDPFYRTLSQDLILVRDTQRWIRPYALWEALPHALSLRQALNLSRRLHEVHQRFTADMREERLKQDADLNDTMARLHRQMEERCQWTPAGASDPWEYKGHRVQELVCLMDTQEEGDRMRHCVGDGTYASRAAQGYCRLFSIRETATDRSISTFEVVWDRHKSRPRVQQHYGPHDQRPIPVAADTLRAWLKAKRCEGPWLPNPEYHFAQSQWGALYHARPEQDTEGPVQQRFHEEVRQEVVRRHPALRAASLLPHDPPRYQEGECDWEGEDQFPHE